jgi:phosphoglucosamine mutase
MLGAAVAAGLASGGVSVTTLGYAPTPAVSYLAREQGYGIGVVISASHNPAPDNGIKFFGHDGRKLPDEAELAIEANMEASTDRPTAGNIGWIESDPSGLQSYLDFLESQVPERLDGLKVVIDAANGAGYVLAPEILKRLGAEVIAIGIEPGEGTKINAEGGATKPQVVQSATAEHGADFGVALDGDADRAVFSDSAGRLINGDRTMAMWARQAQLDGDLTPSVVVGTVMSNMGFERYLIANGIALDRAKVGDKYVAQRISETGAKIGGEQSGHVIFPHLAPTGDGLQTMLQTLRVLKRSGRRSNELFDDFANWPQLLINVAVEKKDGWETLLADDLSSAESRLNGRGRVNVRPSGTQPMIRVMVEADDEALRDEIADGLAHKLVRGLNGHVEGRVDLTFELGD